MRVRHVEAQDRAAWERFVETRPSTTAYHQLGWKRVVEQAFGHQTYYLVAEDDQRGITGILPLVHLKSLLFGNYMVSLPFVNYGGLCSDDLESARLLLQSAIEIGRQQGAKHIEFRDQCPSEQGLPVKTSKISMVMGLPQQAEQLWDAFSPKLRSQIRKPQKEGLYARVGGKDELGSFYAVFSVNMRDLGTPVYSKRFFEVILETFPNSTWICTVYNDRRVPLASGLLICFKGIVEIPWASSLREYNRLSPNMLMYWTALEHSCKRGAKTFDFGRSSPDSSTYKFKQQWGANPKLLYWHYWLRNGGPLPELNPHNPKYQMAINLWKRLPLAMTKLFGPAIVKNLP
ncbi:MAG: FemAB family PEP-CTERM system-associated protein [Nitrospira sp.]|nr:FemAB family PEP-CTERM system-associated protein [Nitrospira sp.]